MKAFQVIAVVAVVAGGVVWGAEKVKLSTVTPVADLVTEVDATVKTIEPLVANEEVFKKAKDDKEFGKYFGLLAVLGQAIAEHDEDSALKASAADLRDAALSGARPQTLEDAKKALDGVKAAAGGKKGSAAVEHPWNKLIGMHRLMDVMNAQNSKLRSVSRRLPNDTTELQRRANVLALLAVVTATDPHDVKDPKQIPDWEKYSKEMQVEMTGLAKALKAKDADAAKKHYLAASKSCNSCHSEIRDKK